MKTKVFHVIEFDPFWCKDNDPAPDELTLVAEIDGDLGDAFRLTQNIEDSWTENDKVDAKVAEARSTSIGDLIVEDGIGHIIMPSGYRTVKKHLQSWIDGLAQNSQETK